MLKISQVKQIALALALIVTAADAALISRITTFSDGQILYSADLNGEFNNAINGINSVDDANISTSANILPSKISPVIDGAGISRDGGTGALSAKTDNSTLEVDSDSIRIKDAGITTAKIGDSQVTTAKIADANVTAAKLASDSVTTVKILDANVTTAKILDANVTTAKIADANVTTAKIADANVTTAKIADANVTQAKLAARATGTTVAAGGVALSGDSGVYANPGGLNTPTNMSVTITTTGRPIRVAVVSSNGGQSGISSSGGSLYLYRGATRIAYMDATLFRPNIEKIDASVAGTYTFTFRIDGTTTVNYLQLIAYEL